MTISPENARHITIIGGGIGGLAAALALQQAGSTATIYERATDLRAVGAGLSLWPNAVKVLDALGVGATLRAQSVPHLSGAIRSQRGDLLVRATQVDWQAQFGAPTVIMHRAVLLALLCAQLPNNALHLGATLVAHTQDADGCTAHFADGRAVRSDALIGADGLHSVVRTQLWGDTPPHYAGYTAWRAVVRSPTPLAAGGESWGHGARFGYIPMADGWVYWYATANVPAHTSSLPQHRHDDVAARFRTWHAPIPALIAATDPATILQHAIYDRPPLRQWTCGRVTLLGDAAHPMTPNLGQGACQALEDALVLARCVQTYPDMPRALHAYEAQRLARTSAIVVRSRQLGAIGQWSHPLACAVRNALLRVVPSGVQIQQLAPIIGYEL